MALSFYPRLEFSTKVTEKDAILIFENCPVGEFKNLFERRSSEMEIVIYICIGVIAGVVLQTVISQLKSAGTLRVDDSDPDDGPYLFLELSKNISFIRRKKYVVLKVDPKSYIPHK